MLDAIVDISHYQGRSLDFTVAGLLGAIHKGTQGTTFIDPMYGVNRALALAAGLRFGSYHFGVGGDPLGQAAFYLDSVGPYPHDLMCLDFEANRAGNSMSLPEARVFVGAIHDKTYKWPVLYSGSWLKQLLNGTPDPLLSNCPLWIAEYGPKAVIPPGWAKWSLWQYTDGALGPDAKETPGIGHCDRDRFNGDTLDDFHAFWDYVSPGWRGGSHGGGVANSGGLAGL